MDLKVTQLTGYVRDPKTWKKITVDLLDPAVKLADITSGRDYREYYNASRGGRSYAVPKKDQPGAKSRVSVSVDGESLWDDFENRTTRPHTLWAQPIKDALIAAGWPKTVRLRWSAKAGCSCPCSPAFFITGGPVGLDIGATIAADTPQTTDPDEAAYRRSVLVNDPTIPVSV